MVSRHAFADGRASAGARNTVDSVTGMASLLGLSLSYARDGTGEAMRFCTVNGLAAVCVAVAGSAVAAPLSGLPVPKGAGNAATILVGEVPVPRPHPLRPRIVGHVKDGQAVPLSASAFAARADSGPMASLFAAAEGAAAPQAPAGPMAAAMVATHNASEQTPPRPTFSRGGGDRAALRAALDALKADRYGEAVTRRNALKDPLDRLIVDHFLIRSGSNVVTSTMVTAYAASAPHWPSAALTRVRAEEALSREAPAPEAVIRAMGGSARSPAGVRLLAKAHLARGERERAAQLVRPLWHSQSVGAAMQTAMAADFGALLTVDDHLTRVDKLVALHRFEEAQALRGRLGSGPRAYVDARLAAAQGAGSAASLLARVPADLARRPGYRLAVAEHKRRNDDEAAAADIIEKVDRRSIVDGDAWWVEARIVARTLAEKGDGRRAYRLVTRGFAVGDEERADEAFHAGWIALRHLRDSRAAERHFAALEAISTMPISRARAGYWRARAAEASGDAAAARRHYETAARYGFTYYGQLARAALGQSGTGVGRAPAPTATDRQAIAANDVAEAVRRLIATGHQHRIYPLLDHLAETVPTAGQLALVVALAEEAGQPHLSLLVAKEGQRRGLPVAGLAYPSTAIPRTAAMPSGLDPALVYAIARQESLFNPGAVSPAGARGLMQVMPQTAATMARTLGMPYSESRLADPGYNATLGAAYLAKRLAEFDGSYILTFAAYNAGAARVGEWIGRFGDPRERAVDPVDWVEQIPYPETRNYVQRVMENVQVYREVLGTGRLAIETDLDRGRPS